MHAFLSDPYSLAVTVVCTLGATASLAYRVGLAVSSSRISRRLKSDREFAIAVLEDLAGHWGVKVERLETPGGPPPA